VRNSLVVLLIAGTAAGLAQAQTADWTGYYTLANNNRDLAGTGFK
jgi:hypothetical protein